MGEIIRRRVRSQYGVGEIEREGLLLGHLGVVGEPRRYEEQVYGLLDGEVNGLYDPHDECLYVTAGTSPAELDGTLAHEITHALQDQHFDLDRLLRRVPGESDRLQAASALVEGDATAVARAFDEQSTRLERRWVREIRRALAEPLPTRRDPLSRYVYRSLSFSYADGLAFVGRAHDRGGWRAVDALLRRPPASSEEVLHPGRADSPVIVELRGADLGGAGHILHDDTLGEQGLRAILAEQLGERAAAEAARGWAGDRALLIDLGGGSTSTGAAVVTLWDEPPRRGQAPSARFAAALDGALERRHDGGRSLPARDGAAPRTHRPGPGLCSAAHHRGRVVLYLESLPCSRVEAASDALFRAAERALER